MTNGFELVWLEALLGRFRESCRQREVGGRRKSTDYDDIFSQDVYSKEVGIGTEDHSQITISILSCESRDLQMSSVMSRKERRTRASRRHFDWAFPLGERKET